MHSVSIVPLSNAVKKIRSPQMHGDELPDETSIFHKTFDEGPKWTGGASPSATLELFGPRNWGQEDAASRPETSVKKRTASRIEIRGKIIVRFSLEIAAIKPLASAR